MNETIVDNIDRIADHFGFSISKGRKCYLGSCPIHQGDNPTALNFYHTGHTAIGNWQCKTHGCHKIFGKNSIGFIRGLLSANKHRWSKRGDEEAAYAETVLWCEKFFGIKYTSDKMELNEDTSISYSINRIYTEEKIPCSFQITDKQYRNSGLEFPSPYFLGRGYESETLNEFSIGYCSNPKKPMYTRSVVPLHSHDGKSIVGCLGRSVWDKCDLCSCYHDPNNMCPSKERKGIYSKWKNSLNYPGSFELYNFHRARKFIEKSGVVILTEGSPNVWRLFEADFPMSLSCNAANFTAQQKKILDISGANTIIIVPDADEASKFLVEKVIDVCKMSYNIVTIEPSYDDDIGQCNIETVKTILSPFVNKYMENQ